MIELWTRRSPRLAKAVVGLIAGLALSLSTTDPSNSAETQLNYQIESFSINLSPLKINETESTKIGALIYAPLVAVDYGGKVEPRLAQSWKSAPDGTLEFVLKENVSFSNGQPVRSADVVSSICRAMQPSSPWAWALASIDREISSDGSSADCTGLEAVDDRIVRVRQTDPVDWLLHALDGPPGWIVPAEAAEGEYGVMPGAGPYVVDNILSGVRVELAARNEGGAIEPGASRVVFHHVPDPSQAATMFRNGDLDVLALSSPTLIELVLGASSPGTPRLVESPSDRVRLVIVNEARLAEKGLSPEQVEWFKRRLKAEIDRQAIVAMTDGRIAEPLYTAFLPAAEGAAPPAAPAGEPLPSIGSLEILSESDPYSDLIAATIAKADVPGVELTYRGLEKGILIDTMVKGNYDLISIVLDANIHAATFWEAFFTEGNPFVVFGKPVPGLATIDLETPEGISAAAAAIDETGNWIPVVRELRIVAVQQGVENVRITPAGQVVLDAVVKR